MNSNGYSYVSSRQDRWRASELNPSRRSLEQINMAAKFEVNTFQSPTTKDRNEIPTVYIN